VALGVLFQAHVQVGGQSQAHALGAYQSHVAVNHALFLQPLGAAQHGAGRQAHLFADHVIGLAAVVLPAAQAGTVQLVEGGGAFAHGGGF